MESRVKLLGHPVHPMLVVFPLGLLITAAVFDVVHLVTGAPVWGAVAFWLITAGLIGAVAAAVAGLADYRAIPPGTRAKRVGIRHGFGNAFVVVLFLLRWFLGLDAPAVPSPYATALSLLGAALLGVTAWLGGELVDRLGVGVDDGANLDAPSSLRAERPR
ncbi:MAG: DUF2231 domain-containing protein [Gemmatimonadaceae bacterium]